MEAVPRIPYAPLAPAAQGRVRGAVVGYFKERVGSQFAHQRYVGRSPPAIDEKRGGSAMRTQLLDQPGVVAFAMEFPAGVEGEGSAARRSGKVKLDALGLQPERARRFP